MWKINTQISSQFHTTYHSILWNLFSVFSGTIVFIMYSASLLFHSPVIGRSPINKTFPQFAHFILPSPLHYRRFSFCSDDTAYIVPHKFSRQTTQVSNMPAAFIQNSKFKYSGSRSADYNFGHEWRSKLAYESG